MTWVMATVNGGGRARLWPGLFPQFPMRMASIYHEELGVLTGARATGFHCVARVMTMATAGL